MNLTRRALLKSSGVFAGASVINQEANLTYKIAKNTISLCLNLSTIMGQNLGFIKELQIAQDETVDSLESRIKELESVAIIEAFEKLLA
jgi:folate-dependent phosphoribosylglycinamide formyltransferase PurN